MSLEDFPDPPNKLPSERFVGVASEIYAKSALERGLTVDSEIDEELVGMITQAGFIVEQDYSIGIERTTQTLATLLSNRAHRETAFALATQQREAKEE